MKEITPEPVEMSWPLPGIAVATLTRGQQLNTLTVEMIASLGAAVGRAERENARVLLITGSGRAFCGGAHVKYFTAPDPDLAGSALAIRDRYVRPIVELFDRLQAMPFVTIAAINGFALGGGCELALACDFRVMAQGAKLGLTEVRLGTIPGAGGVQHLAKIVGRAKALEVILLGEHLSAAEALAGGLVTSVSPDDALMDDALALAKRFTRSSPIAIAEAKRAIYRCQTADTASAAAIGLDGVAVVAGSADWTEGMAAFVAKRTPGFAV